VKVKLDENITAVAKGLLTEFGHDCETVIDEGMNGATDPRLLEACRKERRLLMTFDIGFGDIRAYPPSGHQGIVVLRLHDQQPQIVLDVLRKFLLSTDLNQLAGCLCVVTENRVRIRRQ
jgi:predicted nuclease of predicted toxin-antitoxin system